jgi:hypothetical protein
MALLDIVLVVISLRAFLVCHKSLFLVLATGCLAFVYVNLVDATLSIFGATHIRIFLLFVMRGLSSLMIVVAPLGAVTWFIGTVLLVRFALSCYQTPKI